MKKDAVKYYVKRVAKLEAEVERLWEALEIIDTGFGVRGANQLRKIARNAIANKSPGLKG